MEHEKFPTPGFEFMNEPATEEQKDIICQLAERNGTKIARNGTWPDPFTRWDAARAIDCVRMQLRKKGLDDGHTLITIPAET